MSDIHKFETSLYLRNSVRGKINIKVVLKSFFSPKNLCSIVSDNILRNIFCEVSLITSKTR